MGSGVCGLLRTSTLVSQLKAGAVYPSLKQICGGGGGVSRYEIVVLTPAQAVKCSSRRIKELLIKYPPSQELLRQNSWEEEGLGIEGSAADGASAEGGVPAASEAPAGGGIPAAVGLPDQMELLHGRVELSPGRSILVEPSSSEVVDRMHRLAALNMSDVGEEVTILLKDEHRSHSAELLRVYSILKQRPHWADLSPSQMRYCISLMRRVVLREGESVCRDDTATEKTGVWIVLEGSTDSADNQNIIGENEVIALANFLEEADHPPSIPAWNLTVNVVGSESFIAWYLSTIDYCLDIHVRRMEVIIHNRLKLAATDQKSIRES